MIMKGKAIITALAMPIRFGIGFAEDVHLSAWTFVDVVSIMAMLALVILILDAMLVFYAFSIL